ncbi:MHS family MFS transporter (plasmid) [Rhodococcus aetherivorans]|uniref:Putative proline/betaine transporter n=1 Tax=Rhodococcus aetherivorans TaxID=191292 RepID=A0AA46SGL8_9NOCA|nr:MFS transporter [Rhodococcus aetherivorans]UYF97249.1 MHS family MFS transporter [Rhodococcus aetherivorans]
MNESLDVRSDAHAPAISTEKRRVLLGTLVGTSIEWYDFFVYASAAALVFGELFFQPLGSQSSTLTQIVSFASIGISFLFRPFGAVVAGHLGDRLGRKKMLVFTLLLMGGSTALIGLLPTYAQIGVWAPILLTLLRILQGISAGGEWGGAALMAVEHAPRNRRGLFGAFPQIGCPIGMFLASMVFTGLTFMMSTEQFMEWGWRIPFLLSAALIFIGYFIRRAIDESPVFQELLERRTQSSAPLGELFRSHSKTLVKCALIFMGNNAAGWLLIAYISSYATKEVGLEKGPVLAATMVAAVAWVGTTLWGGMVADKLGRVRAFQLGYGALILWLVPLFLLIDTGNIWLLALGVLVLTVGLGFSYGPISAMYAEMFPAEVRYSGVSIGYAIGTILGGAFAPTVAQSLLDATGWSPSIGIYVTALCLVSFLTVTLTRETRGTDLAPKNATEKSVDVTV